MKNSLKKAIRELRGLYDSIGDQTINDTRNKVHETLSKIKYSEIFREKSLIVDVRNGNWYTFSNPVQQLRYWWEYVIDVGEITPEKKIYEKNPETGENYIAEENDFTIEEYLKKNDIKIEEFGKFHEPILKYGRHKTIFLNEIRNSMCYNGCMLAEDDFLKLCDEFDFITREKLEKWGFTIEG